MKKRKIIFLVVSLFFISSSLGCFIGVNLMNTHSKTDNKTESVKETKSSRSLSMMLETGSNTGVYEQTTRSTWPTDGYLFNAELSKCENGGKLSWNDENNTVVMIGSTSDKCYVYFDVYSLAVINSLTEETTKTSIKLTINATSGTKPITKYYYSKDNGTSYTESTSNTYTFSGLTAGTTYNMKVYVVDEKGKHSEVYSKSVSTFNVTLAEYVKSKYTGTQGSNGIYLHNSSLANGAGDGSYRYAGGDYVLTSKATNAGLTTVITADNTSTNGVINFYCNGSKSFVGATCSSSQTHYYTLQYDSSNTQYETYSAALAKAVTDGYLTKDNVKNFVCFGSDTTPCPTANLYRIIGVFGDQVKLIKWDYATSAMLGTNGDFYKQYSSFHSGEQGESPSSSALYYWNNVNFNAAYDATSNRNVWSYSQLNTINLNTNYITYLNNQNSKWAQKIATTTWKVGGNTNNNIKYSAMNTAYQNEIVNPSTDLSEQYRTYSAKIGLMYVSDYGYAASPTYWTYKGYDTATTDYRAAKSNNWLYGGGWDWTISRRSDYLNDTFWVINNGCVYNGTSSDGSGDVRPTFYLTSNVQYDKGSGTISDPILIK